MTTDHTTLAAVPVWQRFFKALDRLDDEGLGGLHGMARYWKQTLPAEVAYLADFLDAVRDLPIGLIANQYGVAFEEIQSVVDAALVTAGDSDG